MLDDKNLDKSEVLTTGQIAKICRVDPRTVTRWIEGGELKAFELPMTGFKRVCIGDFLSFLRTHKIPVAASYGRLLRPRILIVDDEASMRRAIERALGFPDSEKYEFDFAQDGFEAGKKIALFKPDLVILDVFMPKLDGFGVLKNIRENPDTRAIRVLVISALIPGNERESALKHGADDFLSKPFEDADLQGRVNRLLTRRAASPGAAEEGSR